MSPLHSLFRLAGKTTLRRDKSLSLPFFRKEVLSIDPGLARTNHAKLVAVLDLKSNLTAFLLALLAAAVPARAQTFSVLTSFQGGIDGAQPGNLLVQNNVLYAVVADQGVYGSGAIIGLNLVTGTRQTLYSFTGGGDGEAPDTIVSVGGHLFGTCLGGGSSQSILGGGTLFGLDPATDAPNRLIAFTGANGALVNGLIESAGVLYGATLYSATGYNGSVFKYDPATRQQTVFQSFNENTSGYQPRGLAVIGNALYGIAQGGILKNGFIFRIDLATGQESTVYQFTGGADQENPGGMAGDGSATLYGTTLGGGATGHYGTIFAFDTQTGTLATLYSFTGTADGKSPFAAVFAGGRLFGYTGFLVEGLDYGSIFQFDPANAKFATLHRFTGLDGRGPSSLVAAGNALYGAIATGGPTQSGVIFKLVP